MKAHLAPVRSLILDRKYYPRRHLDTNLTKTYAEAMLAGAKFPPVTVATVQGRRIVLDGWHRVHAAKRVKMANIAANDVGSLNPTEAFAEAVRSNTIHGQALNHREKLEAYRRLVREGMSVQRVSAEIVFIPPGQARKYTGKASRIGGPLPSAFLQPMAPVLTVRDGKLLAGSVSMNDAGSVDLLVRALGVVGVLRIAVAVVRDTRTDWTVGENAVVLEQLRSAVALVKPVAISKAR